MDPGKTLTGREIERVRERKTKQPILVGTRGGRREKEEDDLSRQSVCLEKEKERTVKKSLGCQNCLINYGKVLVAGIFHFSKVSKKLENAFEIE